MSSDRRLQASMARWRASSSVVPPDHRRRDFAVGIDARPIAAVCASARPHAASAAAAKRRHHRAESRISRDRMIHGRRPRSLQLMPPRHAAQAAIHAGGDQLGSCVDRCAVDRDRQIAQNCFSGTRTIEAVEGVGDLDLAAEAAREGARRRRSRACPPPSPRGRRSSRARPRRRRRGRWRRRRPAALGLDARDEVLLGRLHDGHAGVGIDDLLGCRPAG